MDGAARPAGRLSRGPHVLGRFGRQSLRRRQPVRPHAEVRAQEGRRPRAPDQGALGGAEALMITRREFVAALGVATTVRDVGAHVGAGFSPPASAQDDIAGLYDRSIVIDALANPGSMNVSWPPRGPLSQKQRDAIAASGITAINVTVSADFEGSVRNIALWQGEADRYPTLLSIVRRHSDIAKAKQDKTLGLMLGFQNTGMIERDIARVDMFHRL